MGAGKAQREGMLRRRDVVIVRKRAVANGLSSTYCHPQLQLCHQLCHPEARVLCGPKDPCTPSPRQRTHEGVLTTQPNSSAGCPRLLISRARPAQRVARPSRTLRRAGTTKAYATGFVPKGQKSSRQQRCPPLQTTQGRSTLSYRWRKQTSSKGGPPTPPKTCCGPAAGPPAMGSFDCAAAPRGAKQPLRSG